nr:glycosyltransferase [uncultured Dyadobacter sp.]
MKRVLLLSTVHPSLDPRIMHKIAPALQKHYEVICAMPNAKRSGAPDGISLVSLPHFDRLFWRLLVTHPITLIKCAGLRPHIVHIFVPELLPIAFLFEWLGAHVIYEVQENLYKKFAIKHYNNSPVFRRLFTVFDQAARRRFHFIFTDAGYLSEYQKLTRPFAIVRNYVSIPFVDAVEQAPKAPENPEFFYLGVISTERCLDTLLVALAHLKKVFPGFHMHLFGPLRLNANQLAALPGYQDVSANLTFYGYTDQQFAFRVAGRALAAIALLKPVADYIESYPTKLFEYMALRLPFITSDFPIYKEIAEHSECGFCISPYDPDALYEKLVWFIKNDAQRAAMGERGRIAAERLYNWKSEETTLLSYYAQILSM